MAKTDCTKKSLKLRLPKLFKSAYKLQWHLYPINTSINFKTRRRPPDVDEKSIEHLYHTTNTAILGVIVAFLLLGIFLFVILIAKYRNRHKGEYLTREDEGAHDAFDADTAVLQGRTGHQVEKKKEWFI